MTWIMFSNKILHPESGNCFNIVCEHPKFAYINYYHFTNSEHQAFESFTSETEAQARFLELQKMLIKEQEPTVTHGSCKFDSSYLKNLSKNKKLGWEEL